MLRLKKTSVTTLSVLVFILLVSGFLVYSRLAPNGIFADLKNDLKVIAPSEGNAYTDLAGNPVSLSSFKGKPLVVNSWASWVPFSVSELPLLAALQNKFSDKINVLAINRKEDRVVIKAYLNTYSISSDVLTILYDPTDHFYKAAEGYAMPETIVNAADGTIAFRKRGVLSESEIFSVVEALLRE